MKTFLTRAVPPKQDLIQKAYFISLLFVSVSIFSPKLALTNLAVMVLGLVWVVDGKFVDKYKRLKKNPVALAFMALFVLYLIGVFYTDETHVGFKSLETKVPLLLFPLILGSASIEREYLRKTLLTFAYLCAGLSLVALIYQSFVVLEKNDFNYFFSDGLVSIMDKRAVFYAMYVVFSILILVDDLWKNLGKSSSKKKVLTISTIIFLLLFLFLLATRASLAIVLVMLVTSLLVVGIRYGKLKYALPIVAALMVFLMGLALIFPQTVARFKSLRNISYDFTNTEGTYHFSGEDSDSKWNGVNLRLAKWVCAIGVISENPLGVGTGDVKNEMVEAYKKRNFAYAAEKRFDPHNQYLDTAVAIGISGLFVLLFCYFYALFEAIRRKSWLTSMFLILVITCSITESTLSSAQGIIFICFMLFILLSRVTTRNLI